MSTYAVRRGSRVMLLVTVLLGLSACSLQPHQAPGRIGAPSSKPHPHFAPPPQGPSHWDEKLGAHVLENTPAVYYRQRTYYRWNNGWSWAVQPQGPWQACASSAVPAGLSRHYGQ
jgi:hypothetical protein